MQEVISELLAKEAGEVRENEQMAPYTTWKIGGPADIFIIPRTKEQLIHAVQVLHKHGTPWFLLGKGSNLLVADKGIRGAVLQLGEELQQIRFEGNRVYAGGGFSMMVLSRTAGKQGLTGLEFAGGIPGSVGGAVFMNAGAHGSDVSRILMQAEVLLDNGELTVLKKEDMQYAYRHSILREKRGIVTEAVFELSPGDRADIGAANAAYRERRLRTQPLQSPCAGSVFRNPEGHFAAKLIEEAGLKGTKVGGAEISTLHANFIINTGHATASDVLTLIEQVKTVIYDKHRIPMLPEVLMVGEFT